MGIAEQWKGDARNPNEWRDTHFQVEIPAVQGLQAAFLDNWVEAGQTVREDVAQLKCDEDYRQRGLFKRAKIMVASLFQNQT